MKSVEKPLFKPISTICFVHLLIIFYCLINKKKEIIIVNKKNVHNILF